MCIRDSVGSEMCIRDSTRAYIVESRADAVRMFRDFIFFFEAELAELRGKDLACWCAEDQPCHADVLLEWANAPGGAE
jgi:hypothetical protein